MKFEFKKKCCIYGHFAIPEILSGVDPNAAVVLLGDGCDWYIHYSAIVNHFEFFFEVGKYWMCGKKP